MSKPNPVVKTSSLSSLSKPPSAPSSPLISSSSISSGIARAASPAPADDVVQQLQATSQSHTTDIANMQLLLKNIVTVMENVSSKIDQFSSTNNVQSVSTPAFANANANMCDNNTNSVNSSSIVTNTSQTNTIQNRIQNSNSISNAAKALYDLPISEQQSILQYAASASNVNSSFNELDDTVANTISDEIKVSTNNTNSYNFISKLLPVTADAMNPPSMDEIFKAGFKAAASNPKVKDANAFIELLIEQAKVITSTNTSTNNNQPVADYLHYSLQLIKLLFEFGLHAVVEFHFKVMKKIQQTNCALTADHPILLFELVTKYKRLNHTNLLHSTPVYFNTNNNSYNNNNKARSFGRNIKFSGTPCAFHTAKLGRPANHSEAECRVAKQQSKQ